MKKRDALRAWLAESIPALNDDPSRFLVFTDKGTLRATGVRNPGGICAFEWRYTVTLLLLDFAGDPDAVAVALFAWVAVHEPTLLLNYDQNRQGISFEADVLDGGKVDLQINVELGDRVRCAPREGGGYEIEHLPEPTIAGEETWPGLATPPPPATEIWAGGEVIATVPGG